tara:strand:+ start:821 stop:2695 length:1875 start_codon:yes stop_codon:yes gene_type:complete
MPLLRKRTLLPADLCETNDAVTDTQRSSTAHAKRGRTSQRQRSSPKIYTDDARAELLNAIRANDAAWTSRSIARIFVKEKQDPHELLSLLCKQGLALVNESWEASVCDALGRVTTTDVVVDGKRRVFDRIAYLFDGAYERPRAMAILFRTLFAIVRSEKGVFDKGMHVHESEHGVPTQDAMMKLQDCIAWCIRRTGEFIPRGQVLLGVKYDALDCDGYRMADLLAETMRPTQCDVTAVAQTRQPHFLPFIARTLTCSQMTGPTEPRMGFCFSTKFSHGVIAAEVWPDISVPINFHSDLFVGWGYTRADTLSGYNALLNAVLFTTLTFYSTFTAFAKTALGSCWVLELIKALGGRGCYRIHYQNHEHGRVGTPALIKHPIVHSGQLFFWMYLSHERVGKLLGADVQDVSHSVAHSAQEWAPLLLGIYNRKFDDPAVAQAVRRTVWFSGVSMSRWNDSSAIDTHETLQRSVRVGGATQRLQFYETSEYRMNVKSALDNACMILAATASPRAANVPLAPLCKRVRAVFRLLLLCARRSGGKHNVFGMLTDDLLIRVVFPHAFADVNPAGARWFQTLPTSQKYGYTGQWEGVAHRTSRTAWPSVRLVLKGLDGFSTRGNACDTPDACV